MKISFYELKEREDLKYVVIMSVDESGNVYVKHKERDTWEIPGGHIESGETPLYAAKRELIEETGAKDFTLEEILKRRQEDNQRLNTIRQLEIELLSYEVRKNFKRLNELIADDFIEFGASGNRYDKKIVIESLPSQDEFHYSIHDFTERRFARDTIHVTYRLEKDTTSSLRSSIWRLNNDQWQMIFHQGTNQKIEKEI